METYNNMKLQLVENPTGYYTEFQLPPTSVSGGSTRYYSNFYVGPLKAHEQYYVKFPLVTPYYTTNVAIYVSH